LNLTVKKPYPWLSYESFEEERLRKAKFFYLTMIKTAELSLWLVVKSIVKIWKEKGE